MALRGDEEGGALLEFLKRYDKALESEEIRRLFYVAVTRAKESLSYVYIAPQRKDDGTTGKADLPWFDPCLTDDERANIYGENEPNEESPNEESIEIDETIDEPPLFRPSESLVASVLRKMTENVGVEAHVEE
jgi:ATP-dependent exoDNAse (exonuclease V) beta subunit